MSDLVKKHTPEENASRLQALIEMATDAIITINESGIIETANLATSNLFGYERSEMIGKNVSMLMTQRDRSQHDKYMQNYQQTSHAKIIGIGREVWGQRKNGDEFPLRLAVSETKFPDRRIYTGILHDISQLKKAEAEVLSLNQQLEEKVKIRTEELAQAFQELSKTNQVLEQQIEQRKLSEKTLLQREKELRNALSKEKELGELKSRFVSMASHEFKTPLSTILSSVELINMYQATEQQDKRNKHSTKIQAAVKQLTEILNDFLSLSRLEQGDMDINRRWELLYEIIKAAIDAASGQLKVAQHVRLEMEETNELVYTDPKILQAILINLLSNAAKYSNEGQEVSISVQFTDSHYYIVVSDQGIGIPEQEQSRLFTRFFRASNVENIKGTGLGLNIVSQYMELLHGEISFKSRENQGTRFTLAFPKSINQ